MLIAIKKCDVCGASTLATDPAGYEKSAIFDLAIVDEIWQIKKDMWYQIDKDDLKNKVLCPNCALSLKAQYDAANKNRERAILEAFGIKNKV